MIYVGLIVLGLLVGLALSPWLFVYSLLARSDVKPMPEKDLLQILVSRVIEYWDAIMALGVAFIGAMLSYLQRLREGKVTRVLVDGAIEIMASWFFAALAFGISTAIGLKIGASLAITGYCAYKGAAWTSKVIDNFVAGKFK